MFRKSHLYTQTYMYTDSGSVLVEFVGDLEVADKNLMRPTNE